MVKFSLSSFSLSNLRSVVNKIDMYKEHKCSIVINNAFNIEMPVIVAAVLSKSITEMLENDPTLQTFKFTLSTLNNNNKEVFDKIIEYSERELSSDDLIDEINKSGIIFSPWDIEDIYGSDHNRNRRRYLSKRNANSII